MTQILKDPKQAAFYLKQGHVVAVPTETVYGLAAAFDDKEALNAIYRLKNRPSDNPLIVHVSCLEMVDEIAYIDESFLKLHQHFMPGPLTVLLKKKEGVLDEICRGLDTVAIRMSQHPLLNDVINELKKPLAAPSANLSGKPSATCIEHVLEDFSSSLNYALEGGHCLGGIESTIIKVESDHAVILRPGLITQKELEKVLNLPVVFANKEAKLQAPGMKYRHYSPEAKIHIKEKLSDDELRQEKTLILSEDYIDHPFYEKLSAQNLYRAFRKADQIGLTTILIVVSNTIDEGLMNRILKAKT